MKILVLLMCIAEVAIAQDLPTEVVGRSGNIFRASKSKCENFYEKDIPSATKAKARSVATRGCRGPIRRISEWTFTKHCLSGFYVNWNLSARFACLERRTQLELEGEKATHLFNAIPAPFHAIDISVSISCHSDLIEEYNGVGRLLGYSHKWICTIKDGMQTTTIVDLTDRAGNQIQAQGARLLHTALPVWTEPRTQKDVMLQKLATVVCSKGQTLSCLVSGIIKQ